jgi:hypothetical protein
MLQGAGIQAPGGMAGVVFDAEGISGVGITTAMRPGGRS